MGRTVPTFRRVLESFCIEWKDFKKTLRTFDQDVFDSLMNHARNHAAAGHNFPYPNPFEPIAMSILLEHEKMLSRLLKELEKQQEDK
jgi:hypothetical protein